MSVVLSALRTAGAVRACVCIEFTVTAVERPRTLGSGYLLYPGVVPPPTGPPKRCCSQPHVPRRGASLEGSTCPAPSLPRPQGLVVRSPGLADRTVTLPTPTLCSTRTIARSGPARPLAWSDGSGSFLRCVPPEGGSDLGRATLLWLHDAPAPTATPLAVPPWRVACPVGVSDREPTSPRVTPRTAVLLRRDAVPDSACVVPRQVGLTLAVSPGERWGQDATASLPVCPLARHPPTGLARAGHGAPTFLYPPCRIQVVPLTFALLGRGCGTAIPVR